ncbi:MAG: phosphoglucosamine mutase [Oscillospiraceae bacterium]|jgi:phosphoglucosamine mutase|nr:phosphoglucosamine mutase [Oscillospiraceae bacterium]
MARLFGTDGIRGVANKELDCLLAMKTGQAAAEVLTGMSHHRPLFVIGKDTRISSDMLESALAAGICSVGGDVLLLGAVPTPAVAYLTVKLRADAGIMISASHNPYEYNGIKLFGAEGFKLTDETEDKIEEVIGRGASLKLGGEIGRIRDAKNEVGKYIDYIIHSAEKDLSGLKVLFDCANGSASATARDIFLKLIPNAGFLADEPDGININDGCGSTQLDILGKKVVEGGYDIGVAFDGDADRCLIINENGGAVDGDHIMAVCGTHLKKEGRLRGDTIVATVMSNLGFHMFAGENGLKVVCAAVGDRYVLEEMQKGGYVLGGEQSGHLIFLDEATTGDGQLTAVKYLSVLAASGGKASQLDEGIKQYPQVLKNVTVSNEKKQLLTEDKTVAEETEKAKKLLGGNGRILVRPSGTEALVRVMVEGFEYSAVNEACDIIVNAIEKLK